MCGRFATFDMGGCAREKLGEKLKLGQSDDVLGENPFSRMKTHVLCLGLAVLVAVPAAQAQVFRPETVRGAVAGGVVGAIVGHNDGRRGWEGAAIGAAAGALIGSQVGAARERHLPPVPHRIHDGRFGRHPWTWSPPEYAHRWHPDVRARWHHRHSPYVYRSFDYGWHGPRRVGGWSRDGLILGGVLGAIVGHNDGRRGWEGAAIGAGAGWLLGSLADESARREAERREHGERAWREAEAPPRTERPATVVHHHHYYGASGTMAPANGLFGR